MKTPHTSAATIVTNSAQRGLIDQLQHKHLEDGGSIFAQVFFDGLRIRVLTAKQTTELADAFSRVLGTPLDNNLKRSAFSRPGSPS